MSFTVTASNKFGPIRLERPTARGAFDLARSYRSKGYELISVTNAETGELLAEHDIVDGGSGPMGAHPGGAANT